MTKYSKSTKDPRWQKKRLEILNRDNFTCKECGSTTRTLHVHHKYYKNNKKIWEYPNESLLTLCEKCHKLKHITLEDRINTFIKDLSTYHKMIEVGIE